MNIKKVLESNSSWAQGKDQEFFTKISAGQNPSSLWISCSDSRVCPDTITGSDLGENFVNRNIANQVRPDDIDLLSSLQFSVNVLKVKYVIVCGHNLCQGIKSSFNRDNGLDKVDRWIDPIREIINQNREELDSLNESTKYSRLIELNVKAQVKNLIKTETIQNAWKRGDSPIIYGFVFDCGTGLLKEICEEKKL
ncbi:MAG: carbonic anhydrase [Epsilonproteobacteria bacterium]|nr:MAG: carbonic anhydrase [Campylobacterota bacterium]RLA66854.1 MAG: carbonic anhydrase [Campylobacterota bacterium]